MSYDVSIYVETGESEDASVCVFDRNQTSNVARMWRAAGVDLSEWKDRPVGEVVEPLSEAVAAMKADPDKYRAMNPPNGWGSYETCLAFLESILTACRVHDRGVLWVSH